MPKPGTKAVIDKVSSDNLNLVVTTSGTRAAPGTTIVSYILSWGDGHTSNGTGPPPNTSTHRYEMEETYNVSLTILDSHGVRSQDRKQMFVRGPIPIPTPPDTSRGPTPTITCSGGITIPGGSTTASRQALINANPGATFCISNSAPHTADGSNTPTTGQTFIAAYGAVIDGSGWVTSDPLDGIFHAYGIAANNVTIKNLRMINFPQRAITADSFLSNGWLIDHVDIDTGFIGIEIPKTTMFSNSLLRNCTRGGYSGFEADGSTFDNNEIARNGTEQKVGLANNFTFRNNWVHHNVLDGIWYDTIHSPGGILVEGNTVEDNGRDGISLEACNGGLVQNNICRRNGEGILLSGSQSIEVKNNAHESDTICISLFIDLDDVSAERDTQNNNIHDNIVAITATNYVAVFSKAGTIASLVPYQTNTKNNNFNFNTYHTPNPGDFAWFWFANNNFSGWQAIPQDLSGSHLSP